jgi:His/Glu/Gln/Arg/opine family amino acid ABC transporter permease subunit
MIQTLLSLAHSAPLLAQGALMTLVLWLSCACVALCLGIALGIVRCQRLRISYLSVICDSITFVLRGVPFYVQLLIAYFVIPYALNITLSATSAAIFALGLCSAAYVSQSIRAGINSINNGQWEAAAVLGLSTAQTIRFIVLPQTLRTILPTLTNELDQLLKSTSIVSSIGILELTRAGMNIVARDFNPLPVYLTIALLYLAASTVLMLLTTWLEKKLAYPKT